MSPRASTEVKMYSVAVRAWSSLDLAQRERIMARATAAIFEPALVAAIEELFEDVRQRGDDAVRDATARFDGVDGPAYRPWVTDEEIDAARDACNPELLAGIRLAIQTSRAFNERQVARTATPWRDEILPGHVVGEQFAPITSAGLFVPYGKANYPSVLCQIGTPAVVAGVPEITVVVPPVRGTGAVNGPTLAVAAELGTRHILRANGPAAIAALTVGTESIRPVRKIVGPGSPPVTIAQILAARHGIGGHLLCGPSESLLIADDSADPVRLAADLITEAEHGFDSAATLVTDSMALAHAVAEAAESQFGLLGAREAYARAVVSGIGGVVVFDSMDAALAFANDYAAEHVQIATRDPEGTLRSLRYAGEALLGQQTPIGASSLTLGIPATLPTGGYAKLNGGVTARAFMTSTSIAELTEEALAAIARETVALALEEGFPAHANSLLLRGLGGPAPAGAKT
jgi:histidinol dehydrogenase